ncbi:MAG: hypothetical protein QM731_17355 [Chitinophagaceae bacterium]
MKSYPQNDNNTPKNLLNEDSSVYATREELEDARLREFMNKPDIEKLYAFTKMWKRNAMLKKAVIIHKK